MQHCLSIMFIDSLLTAVLSKSHRRLRARRSRFFRFSLVCELKICGYRLICSKDLLKCFKENKYTKMQLLR